MKLDVLNSSGPKVAIRPTFDGCLGSLYKSLKKQSMDQARAVAKQILSTLRHTKYQLVECASAATCSGGAKEAASCVEKFACVIVEVLLTATTCGCYNGETMDRNLSVPKAVWGFNHTERRDQVCIASVLANFFHSGIPAFVSADLKGRYAHT